MKKNQKKENLTIPKSLAGIHDFKHFWKVIRRDKKTIIGKVQSCLNNINQVINIKFILLNLIGMIVAPLKALTNLGKKKNQI